MSTGAGKYDDACTLARGLTGGTVILIVINGDHGSGFSVQCTDMRILAKLPVILEDTAQQIREDQNRLKGQTQ